MGRLLGDVQNSNIVSRRADLAVKQEAVVDVTIHPQGDLLHRGDVLAKYVPADASVHVGKFRAYAESLVTVAFSNAAKTFTLDASVRASLNFKAGDVIETTTGTALGTVATYDPATGIGTLVANSANNAAIGLSVRLAKAVWALDLKRGRILTDNLLMETLDAPTSAYREGFFVVSRTALTDSAISELGGAIETADEVRIQ